MIGFIDILAICAFSLMNAIRGGWLKIPGDRIVSSIGAGAVYCLISGSVLAGGIVAAGFYLWALKGWGLYFAAGHGQWARNETEIKWIDRIGLKLIPFVTESRHSSNFLRGILCMGLRGGVYSLPLFLGLSYVHGLEAMFVWPLFFLQGLAYYVAGGLTPGIIHPKNMVRCAEMAWGACIGSIFITL